MSKKNLRHPLDRQNIQQGTMEEDRPGTDVGSAEKKKVELAWSHAQKEW